MVKNAWQKQLAQAVSPLQDGVSSLQVNNFRPSDDAGMRPGRTAAVLVPILDLSEPEILLTRRSTQLANHPGQISFPGGRAEEADDSAVRTALREAEEEVGLNPDMVTPIGFLDRFDSISDYRILPVVGVVNPPVELKLDTREVEEVFTIPLSVALDRRNYRKRPISHSSGSYALHSIEWRGHVVWGLTAAMLLNLSKRMNGRIMS